MHVFKKCSLAAEAAARKPDHRCQSEKGMTRVLRVILGCFVIFVSTKPCQQGVAAARWRCELIYPVGKAFGNSKASMSRNLAEENSGP
jgi:hypothetical protein